MYKPLTTRLPFLGQCFEAATQNKYYPTVWVALLQARKPYARWSRWLWLKDCSTVSLISNWQSLFFSSIKYHSYSNYSVRYFLLSTAPLLLVPLFSHSHTFISVAQSLTWLQYQLLFLFQYSGVLYDILFSKIGTKSSRTNSSHHKHAVKCLQREAGEKTIKP